MLFRSIVRSWMVSLSQDGMSVTSVKRKVSSLKSFYKFLKKEGKITESPLCLISIPKAPGRLPVFVKEDQMEILIDDFEYEEGFKGVRDRLMLVMLYTTGMRRSEMVGLKDDDVDFFNSLIRVTGKGDKQRFIPFGNELSDMIKDYLGLRRLQFSGRGESLFLNDKGLPVTVGFLYNKVKSYLSKVSSPSKKSPHVLRHTFATTMLGNGADLMAVKELLGHSSLSSTEVYTHLSMRELMESYKQAHPRVKKEKGG